MAATQEEIPVLDGSDLEVREAFTVDRVSVVLPCLNEEDSVGLVVQEALRTMADARIVGEVLVVDNGSTDRSVEVAQAAGARVVIEPRRGYGRALRTGISQSSGSIVVMADADFTYDMTKLEALINPVRMGEADIAIGSRLHEANGQNMPLLHRFVGTPALTALVRQAGGDHSVSDSQSGYRCFRKETIESLNLRSDGMEFASEMLIKGSRRNIRVVNVPTGYRLRIGTSKLNTFADGWRHLRLILLLAPELLLLTPGALMLLIGAVFSITAFFPTTRIEIGSLRWQPIFFSGISLVLGLQAVLVGLTFVWHRASTTGAPVSHGLGFVRSRVFPRASSLIGLTFLALGFALDVLLFVRWIHGDPGTFDLPIASLAQSLLLMGGSLGSFGLVVMWLHWDERQNRIKI